MIAATLVADSTAYHQHRLTTVEGVIPRVVLAELNTHRDFSRNSASSRAIPFNKMIEMVQLNPFIPLAFQKDHPGMQGIHYIKNQQALNMRLDQHLRARDAAVKAATELHTPLNDLYSKEEYPFEWEDQEPVTKQICNRYLEPFMWHKVLITSTEWENFFNLRCPQYERPYYLNGDSEPSGHIALRSRGEYLRDCTPEYIATSTPKTDLDWLLSDKGQAEIHIKYFAELIYDEMLKNTPQKLKAGEWHIPYKEHIQIPLDGTEFYTDREVTETKVKISTVMAARTSYTRVDHDLSRWDLPRYLEKFEGLKTAKPIHASPFEHASVTMDFQEYETFTRTKPIYEDNKVIDIKVSKGWCRNFRGFIQARELVESGRL